MIKPDLANDMTSSQLPPNIAVYVRTPVVIAVDPLYNTRETFDLSSIIVHVINSIGFAFDHPEQGPKAYLTDIFLHSPLRFQNITKPDTYRLIGSAW